MSQIKIRTARRDAGRRAGSHPAPVTAGRGRNMQAIRRRDTKPEVSLRRALHARGLRFRKDHVIIAQGRRVRPDLVFTRRRLAVFLDGCFWHCCPDHGRSPQVHQEYWGPKLQRNRDRDLAQTLALQAEDWTVLRFWEHEDPDVMVERVVAIWTTLP